MPRLATFMLLALVLAGCGGGGGDDGGSKPGRHTPTTPKGGDGGDAKLEPRGTPAPAQPRTGPVTRAEKAVIRGWADALRRGDVERAVRYWRVPAIAANGNQPFRLVTRPAVRDFNAGLTCGARLQSVERDKNYLLATFLLTDRRDRPGACAQGVGNRVRTLFLLRGGKIVQWIRAADPPSGSSS
jgi:hypothetical protein